MGAAVLVIIQFGIGIGVNLYTELTSAWIDDRGPDVGICRDT